MENEINKEFFGDGRMMITTMLLSCFISLIGILLTNPLIRISVSDVHVILYNIEFLVPLAILRSGIRMIRDAGYGPMLARSGTYCAVIALYLGIIFVALLPLKTLVM